MRCAVGPGPTAPSAFCTQGRRQAHLIGAFVQCFPGSTGCTACLENPPMIAR
ncbi:hypothetical protein PFLCHA0_c24670 [Pseudomonas protegens CHA0]|uniref:Uncharacterized protein n=1 Tax=Pseudomonas protegens (strain DSM 19095 / LMG 27888 / CFBP 6595 / CHA0) TaxID=1124983 RepID=A0A2C9EL04_PSEPH|nr:hypothetical protein PFLCHA0_c24670 [Pseudomonas protegens CHA0]